MIKFVPFHGILDQRKILDQAINIDIPIMNPKFWILFHSYIWL